MSAMLRSLRKFGLQHHDLPTMLWNVTALLRLLALDIDSRNTRRTPVILHISSAIMIALYFYIFHLSTYWFVFWRGGRDLLFNILILSIGISSSIGVIKLLFMYKNGTGLKKLVSGYLECDALLISHIRMSENINTTLRSVKKRALLFWLIIIGNGIIYVVTPLFTPGKHLPEDGQILFGLEPMFDSPNFEIAYTAICFAVFIAVYAPANITGFLIIVVGYTEAQMLALCQELDHIWEDAQTHYNQEIRVNLRTNCDRLNCSNYTILEELEHITKIKTRIVNHYIRYRLVSIMKSHATNINLIKDIECIFRTAIAVEFSLLSSGLILALLGGLENTYIEVPFGLVQVSMDCLTGQRLMDANKAFEDAVYGCQWENFDVSNRKLVLVMLQNSQKTMQLSAGGLACLNYTSLMYVFKSIYSAYTALRSTMN